MSDSGMKKLEGSDSSSMAPPEDAGRPFVFAAAQNVGVGADKAKKASKASAEDEKDKEASGEGDASRKEPEKGGAAAAAAAASTSSSSSSGAAPSPLPPRQIPMEFMHLQRSQSLRASRDAGAAGGTPGGGGAAGGGTAEGRRNSSSSSAAAADLGKRRSSRAIKRKRFDDEIVDTASCIAPPGSSSSAAAEGATALGHSPEAAAATAAAAAAASAAAAAASSSSSLAPSSAPVAPGTSGHASRHPLPPSFLPGQPEAPKSAPPMLPGAAAPSAGASGAAAAGSSAAAAAAAKLSKGKGVGKIPKSRAFSEWDPSLANSRAALKKKSNKKNKRAKREGAWKDLSRWKPTDDLALITAVQQTHDLASVYRGVKFSCHFTLAEVQERWFALMYEPIISKMAIQAIKNLHPEVILATQRRTLFSKQEQEVVSTIKASTNPPPTLSDFADLLKRHPTVFHHARTPRSLAHYWQSLKQYTLLPDQSVQPLPRENHILNFLDAEGSINDGELFEERDEMTEHELAASDRRVKKEIRHLEAEVTKWQVLVDKVRGDAPPDFDNQTLAVLRGRLVRYLMRSKEITIGRSTADHAVDVDLKLEGPAWKISRKQGVIKLRNSGEFFIANEGKRAMFVDGRPITRGHRSRLCNNSVLEIAGLKFVFLINLDLIEAIRQEAIKMYQNS